MKDSLQLLDLPDKIYDKSSLQVKNYQDQFTFHKRDELDYIKNIAVYRLQFTIEDKEKTKSIIQSFKRKLAKETKERLFDSTTDTRGHFNKEIL